MPIALDNLRVGRIYRLVNMGEVRRIEVMNRISGDNFKIKDLDTLEFYTIYELLQWGKGKDYDLEESR
jgi:hypothetical protein